MTIVRQPKFTPPDGSIECISPFEINPVHEPRDMIFFATLKDDLYEEGWLGRPLIAVVTRYGDLQALTGSHRIAAAREVGLETIPVLVIAGRTASIIEESEHFPNMPPGVADDLYQWDQPWIARFIMMDDWVRNIERPWERQNIQILKDLGHNEMVGIMSVKQWNCPEEAL